MMLIQGIKRILQMFSILIKHKMILFLFLKHNSLLCFNIKWSILILLWNFETIVFLWDIWSEAVPLYFDSTATSELKQLVKIIAGKHLQNAQNTEVLPYSCFSMSTKLWDILARAGSVFKHIIDSNC